METEPVSEVIRFKKTWIRPVHEEQFFHIVELYAV